MEIELAGWKENVPGGLDMPQSLTIAAAFAID